MMLGSHWASLVAGGVGLEMPSREDLFKEPSSVFLSVPFKAPYSEAVYH